MPDPITTPEPLAPAADVTAGDGARAEESVNLSELLGKELGKTFPDDATALKAVKDTFSYVGEFGKYKPVIDAAKEKFGGDENVIKKMSDIIKEPVQPDTAPQPDTTQANPGKESILDSEIPNIKERLFYAENPDYKPYRALIQGFGADPEKVVSSEVFKEAFEKIKAHDETQSSKSVLQTSPRLGEVSDKVTASQEAMAAGKQGEATQLGLDAVMDAAFPEKK